MRDRWGNKQHCVIEARWRIELDGERLKGAKGRGVSVSLTGERGDREEVYDVLIR